MVRTEVPKRRKPMDYNKLFILSYFALCFAVGVLNAKKTRFKFTPVFTGLTAGFCMVLTSLNIVYRQWLAALLIIVSFFWLRGIGETAVKLAQKRFAEIPVISYISLAAFLGILFIIL